MLFGAHVSVGKGYQAMARYAAETGCECAQVFAKSPRQWKARPLAPTRLTEVAGLRGAGTLVPTSTHTSYLINLSTDDDALRDRSVDALADELVRAAQLGFWAVNTHVGTASCAAPADAAASDAQALSDGAARAARRAGLAAAQAWELAELRLAGLADGDWADGPTDARPVLLFEDTAGAGTTFGSSVAELAAAIDASGLSPERLGICIDTCHAWAAGYDLSSQAGIDELLGRVDALAGLGRLRLLHLNDCLHPRAAHKDRHAWIGRGEIGIEGFAALVADPRLAGLSAVTEMPGTPPVKDQANLMVLKALRDGMAPGEALAQAEGRFPDAHQ